MRSLCPCLPSYHRTNVRNHMRSPTVKVPLFFMRFPFYTSLRLRVTQCSESNPTIPLPPAKWTMLEEENFEREWKWARIPLHFFQSIPMTIRLYDERGGLCLLCYIILKSKWGPFFLLWGLDADLQKRQFTSSFFFNKGIPGRKWSCGANQ